MREVEKYKTVFGAVGGPRFRFSQPVTVKMNYTATLCAEMFLKKTGFNLTLYLLLLIVIQTLYWSLISRVAVIRKSWRQWKVLPNIFSFYQMKFS